MKRNILFITSKFIPNADANGICVANVANELKKRGYNIFCICEKGTNELYEEEIDGIKIIRIKPTLYLRIKDYYNNKPMSRIWKVIFIIVKFLRRLKSIVMLPFFPNVSPLRSRKLFTTFKELHKEHGIDCIIGVFRPYEGIHVSVKAKKMYPHITCIAYYLDLLRGITPPKLMPKKIYEKMCINAEIKDLSILDKAMIPEEAKNLYSNPEFSKSSKLAYVDFPLFVPNNKEGETKMQVFEKNYINIVYAGTMDIKNRNPEYLLNILSKVYEKNNKIKFHIYGSLNDASIIVEKYKSKYPDFINFHGRVPYKEINNYLKSADVLINISNKTTPKMIPSKIFQLFAAGKPIINLVKDKNDYSIKYFLDYPLVHYINENIEVNNDDIEELSSFIRQKVDSNIMIEVVKKNFYKNSPEYTAKFIEMVITNNKNPQRGLI